MKATETTEESLLKLKTEKVWMFVTKILAIGFAAGILYSQLQTINEKVSMMNIMMSNVMEGQQAIDKRLLILEDHDRQRSTAIKKSDAKTN